MTPLLVVVATVAAVGIGWEIKESRIRRQARRDLHDTIAADHQYHIRIIDPPTVEVYDWKEGEG